MPRGTPIYTQEEKLLAQKIGKRPDQLPEAILQLLKSTTPSALDHHPCTTLFEHHRITTKEASDWFVAFARGAQYVHETYGVCFGNLSLCRHVIRDGQPPDDNYVAYRQSDDTIVVTAKRIAWDMRHARNPASLFGIRSGSAACYSGLEKIILLGVEEAYHAYQTKHLWFRYAEKHLPPPASFASGEQIRAYYEQDPVERDAQDVTMQAARDMGLGKGAVSQIIRA